MTNQSFETLVAQRRSHRRYSDKPLSAEDVQRILRAALLSPTSKHRRNWDFVVADDKTILEKLSEAKEHGATFLKSAAVAVAVLGTPKDNDCWVEDGSIAAYAMQLQAEDLGLGSCWIQIRGRYLSCGTSASDVIKGILNIPEDKEVLCVLAFGHKEKSIPPNRDEELVWERVHIDTF